MPHLTPQRAMEIALEHHRRGRLQQAEAIYRQILEQDPDHIDALHLMGVVAHQTGRSEIAEELIRAAIEMAPLAAEMHSNLGEVLRARGDLEQAVECYLHAIALQPEQAQAYNNLGAARREQGRLDEAEAALRRAVALDPGNSASHQQLGMVCAMAGQHDRAVEALSTASQLDPANADVLMQLAISLNQLGRPEAALATCRKATQARAQSPEAHQLLGTMLKSQHRFEEAIASFRWAVKLKPGFAEAYCNLGATLQTCGRIEEAIDALTQAIDLKPDFAEALNNLGFCFLQRNRLDEAVTALEKAIKFAPDSAPAYGNLGAALQRMGRVDEAAAALRRAISIRPDMRIAHANLLLAMNYDDRFDAQTVFQEHVRWGERHAGTLRPLGPASDHDRDPNRRLRIGYVSPDFCQHSVAFFIEPVLAAHDRQSVEVFCYSDVDDADETTARLKGYADHWIDARAMTDEQLAQKIRADRIDTLIDLAGHTAGNRLLAFARKPAPVQVSYLGYPNTTGVRAIDYRLTDHFADPAGLTDAFFTERLIRLPNSAWCYRPGEQGPDVAPPPFQSAGHVTFGSFNKETKLSPATMQAWANVLSAAPGSHLVVKSRLLHDPSARTRLAERLARHGIALDRIELLGATTSLSDHLAHYHRIDIALDTFPYNGTTTTCDALWMGVPVVTLAGDRHVSRVGVSLLSNAGLSDLIALSPQDYAAKAVALAQDANRLATLRATLRQQMKSSPLMDSARIARDIESAYRTIWQTWCSNA